jgi:hypothetical protein
VDLYNQNSDSDGSESHSSISSQYSTRSYNRNSDYDLQEDALVTHAEKDIPICAIGGFSVSEEVCIVDFPFP